MRICVIGDELVTGLGDPKALGWVGRVMARSEFELVPTVFQLAMPGETTGDLASRWEDEVTARLGHSGPRALVVGIGCADVSAGLSTARTRLNIANIADRATSLGIPTFFVGPPPLAGVEQGQLKQVSTATQQVAERRNIPFIDCYSPLVSNDQWFEDMASSPARNDYGATMPGQTGYALMSWLVLNRGWYPWSGAEVRG